MVLGNHVCLFTDYLTSTSLDLTWPRKKTVQWPVSSGDPGIYGMAGLIYEVLAGQNWDPKSGMPVEVIPGVSALNSCASIVGSPLMTDFAVVSMSDVQICSYRGKLLQNA